MRGKRDRRSSLRLRRNVQALGIGYFPHRREVCKMKKKIV